MPQFNLPPLPSGDLATLPPSLQRWLLLLNQQIQQQYNRNFNFQEQGLTATGTSATLIPAEATTGLSGPQVFLITVHTYITTPDIAGSISTSVTPSGAVPATPVFLDAFPATGIAIGGYPQWIPQQYYTRTGGRIFPAILYPGDTLNISTSASGTTGLLVYDFVATAKFLS